MWLQPLAGSHASAVQELPSSQPGAVPATQPPFAQRSPAVHTSPSSQVPVLGKCTQPLAGSQESSVQTVPSAQSTVPSTVHAPPAHLVAVQALPSSQASPLLLCTQPTVRSHVSSVQTLSSLQSALILQPTSTSGPVSVSCVSGFCTSAVSCASWASISDPPTSPSCASLAS